MKAAKLSLLMISIKGGIMKSEEQPHAPAICGAKTRNGHPCKTAPVKGKKRCRMHGGAKGSGAPMGNQNALKHGFYSKHTIEMKKAVKNLLFSFI